MAQPLSGVTVFGASFIESEIAVALVHQIATVARDGDFGLAAMERLDKAPVVRIVHLIVVGV